jgi:ferredoxin
MPFVIADPCIDTKEGSCIEVCPVDCIHTAPGEQQYFIDPQECISCGACMDVCPSKAIFPEELVPDKWVATVERNSRFFGR